jgi:putative transposase
MVVPLVRAASKTWRKLNGTNQLPRVIENVRFTDGVVADDANLSRAA